MDARTCGERLWGAVVSTYMLDVLNAVRAHLQFEDEQVGSRRRVEHLDVHGGRVAVWGVLCGQEREHLGLERRRERRVAATKVSAKGAWRDQHLAQARSACQLRSGPFVRNRRAFHSHGPVALHNDGHGEAHLYSHV